MLLLSLYFITLNEGALWRIFLQSSVEKFLAWQGIEPKNLGRGSQSWQSFNRESSDLASQVISKIRNVEPFYTKGRDQVGRKFEGVIKSKVDAEDSILRWCLRPWFEFRYDLNI